MADSKSEISTQKSEIPQPRSPRRWFRFSLGTLFLSLSVLCVVLGAVVNRAHRQARAVAIVKQLGGSVRYDRETREDSEGNSGHAPPPGPDWLSERLGIDYFDDVVKIDLGPMFGPLPVTDQQLVALRHLPKIREIRLIETGITDEGCRHVSTLSTLEYLELSNTKVTDAGVARLARLKSLRDLHLENCPVTNEGLTSLAGLPNLAFLHLSGTEINDAGAERLARFPQLCNIELGRTSVSDCGVRALSKLPLHLLWLDETRVTDVGLGHLRNHATLMVLCVSDTAVGDEGLRHLTTIPNLTYLWLNNTRITGTGALELARCKKLLRLHMAGNRFSLEEFDQLKQTLPNCRVLAD